MENSHTLYRKIRWTKGPHYCGIHETEGFAVAIHDKVIKTRNYKKHRLRVGVIDRHRKCDTVGETSEHVIVGCSSPSESAYLGRHNQLAKIIHQQTAKSYKLLQRNTPPHCRYKPEPVLQSANMILYWERSIITDEKVNFNRPDKVFIDRGGKNSTCNRYSSSLDP